MQPPCLELTEVTTQVQFTPCSSLLGHVRQGPWTALLGPCYPQRLDRIWLMVPGHALQVQLQGGCVDSRPGASVCLY